MKIRILSENIKGLGLGHVARCFNLSVLFLKMGYEVDFFVRGDAEFSNFLDTQISNFESLDSIESSIKSSQNSYFKNFYPLGLQWENLKHKSLIECDICIIDSYKINDFSLFLEHCKAVCIFDDDMRHLELFRQNIPNLFILNQNGLYNMKHFNSPNIFSGISYALLNECFLQQDSKNITESNSKKYDFFICLGGEDKKDFSSVIYEKLHSHNSVCVVLGANYKGKLLHKNDINIFHNITQKKLSNLMKDSKVCIISGGGIIFEAIALCRRVWAINLASNQTAQIEILKNQNLVNGLKIKNIDSRDFIESMLESSPNKKIKIADKTQEMIGNLCMFAINSTLFANNNKKAKNYEIPNFNIESIKKDSIKSSKLLAINFCNLTPTQALRILQYRNHPFVNKNMYSTPEISAKRHFDFLAGLQNDESSKHFLVQEIAQNTQKDIGVINLTRINIRHKHAYLGIYKNPFLDSIESKKKYTISYGSMLMAALKYIAFEIFNLNMLYLEVLEKNTAAIKLYENEGFSKCGSLPNAFKNYENNNFENILIYKLSNKLQIL